MWKEYVYVYLWMGETDIIMMLCTKDCVNFSCVQEQNISSNIVFLL